MENKSLSTARFRIKDLALASLFIALVYIATNINIPSPISANGGLVHLGNVILFAAAIVFGKKKGAVAGAFGMALFDLLSPWVIWAPFTFVVRGIMGYIVGSVAHAKGKSGSSFLFNLIGIILGSAWMLAGYYATEVILYGNLVAPIKSIPGNLIQIVVGAIFGLPLAAALKSALQRLRFI